MHELFCLPCSEHMRVSYACCAAGSVRKLEFVTVMQVKAVFGSGKEKVAVTFQ
jgi:hypothetical protein